MQRDSGIILLTGSSGLIGSALTSRLAEGFAQVIAPERNPLPGCVEIRIDITHHFDMMRP